MSNTYSSNPGIQAAIERLLALGLPPLPVAPMQGDGKVFSGKNPSYLDRNGRPVIIKHGDYQKRPPTDTELNAWFANPKNGIGTLGGHGGIVWLDFDRKCYPSAEECDRDVQSVIERICHVAQVTQEQLWVERTGSGGWRIPVRLEGKPGFTNFATSPDGPHVGEALHLGRFTVLAPSIHPNGNPYQLLHFGIIPKVGTLNAIGIYQYKTAVAAKRASTPVKGYQPSYSGTSADDEKIAVDCLSCISTARADDYDEWLKVGMALYSVSPSLLGEWDSWSQTSPKYEPGCCEAKWRTFGATSGITLGSLIHWAKQDNPSRFTDLSQDWKREPANPIEWLKRQAKKLQRPAAKGFGYIQRGDSNVKLEPASKPEPTPDGTYDSSDRLQVWQDALGKYKFNFDCSGTGSGKSHSAGLMIPGFVPDVKRVIYVSNDHRNPSASTLEEWRDVESRHAGLVEDDLGRIVRARKGDTRKLVEPANCSRTETIAALRSKNVPGADTELVCFHCPLNRECVATKGVGLGFKRDRYSVIGTPYFRIHPASLVPSSEYDYSETAIIVEESATIQTYKEVDVSRRDVEETMAALDDKNASLYETVKALLKAVWKLLKDGELGRFGLSDSKFRELLPEPPIEVDINAIAMELYPDLNYLDEAPSEVATQEAQKPLGVKQNQLNLWHTESQLSDPYTNIDLKWGTKKQNIQSDEQLASRTQTEVSKYWFPEFLQVLTGFIPGAFKVGEDSYGNKRLTIILEDDRFTNILKSAKTVLLLDATAKPEQLARKFDIPLEQMNVIQAKAEDPFKNVEVIQVSGLGRLGISNRSGNQQERVDAVIEEILKIDPNTAIFDFKRHTKAYDNRNAHYRDSRGRNDFEKAATLMTVGIPCRNLNDLESDFRIQKGRSPKSGTEMVKRAIEVTNNQDSNFQHFFEGNESSDPEFREFVRDSINADLLQEWGRLRANRRPDEKLTIYVLGDYALPVPVKLMQAKDISPKAASRRERIEQAISDAVEQLKVAGRKVTQTAIAQLVGCTQGYISRFKELLQTLLSDSNSVCNNLLENNSTSSDLESASVTALESVAAEREIITAEEVNEVFFEWLEPGSWLRVWQRLNSATQNKVLMCLLPAEPELISLLVGTGEPVSS